MSGVHAGPRPCVVLAAARAPWEPALLGVLAEAGIVVLRRCVDLADLLAVVGAGQADVAVLSADLAGLDADVVRRLGAHDVRPLVVAEPGAHLERLSRLGVPVVAGPEDVPAAVEALLASPVPTATGGGPGHGTTIGDTGEVVAVWGATGAPGRTTVALGVAAALAASPDAAGVTLIDADPWGGAVGQALGVLDEASGLLAAARLANEGSLDSDALASCLRRVEDRLDVLTGLPRPDRWVEVRAGVLEDIIGLTAHDGSTVVVDCGFALERDGAALDRNTMTLEALACSGTVVVVGSAEPTGLSRLVRGLVELGDIVPAARVQVVVNRMRDSLGWSSRDVIAMVEGFAPSAPVHVLPLDVSTADRAARDGVPVTALSETPLGRAVAGLTAQLPKSRYSPAKV